MCRNERGGELDPIAPLLTARARQHVSIILAGDLVSLRLRSARFSTADVTCSWSVACSKRLARLVLRAQEARSKTEALAALQKDHADVQQKHDQLKDELEASDLLVKARETGPAAFNSTVSSTVSALLSLGMDAFRCEPTRRVNPWC